MRFKSVWFQSNCAHFLNVYRGLTQWKCLHLTPNVQVFIIIIIPRRRICRQINLQILPAAFPFSYAKHSFYSPLIPMLFSQQKPLLLLLPHWKFWLSRRKQQGLPFSQLAFHLCHKAVGAIVYYQRGENGRTPHCCTRGKSWQIWLKRTVH